MWSIIWLVVFIVLVVFEAATMGLFTIWFAGGALVAFLVSLFVDMWAVQMIAFLIVSFLLLYFTRPVAMRKFNSKRLKTNVEDIAGREAKVTEIIDNYNGTGTAMLNGLEWSARSAEDAVVIPVGERVMVKEVRGVKLIVSPMEKASEDFPEKLIITPGENQKL
ncbi:MAG: NfeD family protein [Lachnospiraceae bacterium]|nr:NfeD family protein [Lachnospiraceae bacterium]